MQLFDLMSSIKNKTLPRFLVFSGSEYAIMNIYINQIANQYKLNKRLITTVDEVIKKQRVISLIGDNNLYICRYDNNFVKQEKEWLGVNNKLGNNYLILILTNFDKRGKFYKQFESVCVEFLEQDFNTVLSMTKKQVNIAPHNLERLVTGCGNNYSKCLLEIDKIKCLSKVRNITEDQAYVDLVNDGAIYEIQESKLQEFTNAVMTKDISCFSKYKALIRNNEPNMIIITWLYNAVRNQLSVQTVGNANQETTGLKYFFIKECLDRKGYYTNKELLHFLDIIRYCEQGIKLGWMEDVNSVEYILASVM